MEKPAKGGFGNVGSPQIGGAFKKREPKQYAYYYLNNTEWGGGGGGITYSVYT